MALEMTKFDGIPDEKHIISLLMQETGLTEDLLRVVVLPEKQQVHTFILQEMDIDEFYMGPTREYIRSFGYTPIHISMDGVQKVEVDV